MPSSGSNGHNPSNGKPGSHIKVEPTTFGAAARWADQCQQKGQQSCGLLHGGPFSDPFPGHRRKWRPPGSDARQASLRKDSDAAGGNASKRRQDGFMVSGVLGTDQFAEHSAPPPRWRRPTVCRPMGKPLAHYPALLQRIVEAIEARGKSRNGRITIRDLRPLADGGGMLDFTKGGTSAITNGSSGSGERFHFCSGGHHGSSLPLTPTEKSELDQLTGGSLSELAKLLRNYVTQADNDTRYSLGGFIADNQVELEMRHEDTIPPGRLKFVVAQNRAGKTDADENDHHLDGDNSVVDGTSFPAWDGVDRDIRNQPATKQSAGQPWNSLRDGTSSYFTPVGKENRGTDRNHGQQQGSRVGGLSRTKGGPSGGSGVTSRPGGAESIPVSLQGAPPAWMKPGSQLTDRKRIGDGIGAHYAAPTEPPAAVAARARREAWPLAKAEATHSHHMLMQRKLARAKRIQERQRCAQERARSKHAVYPRDPHRPWRG